MKGLLLIGLFLIGCEDLREPDCGECGLVLAENIFEETSAGRERGADPESDRTHNVNRVGFTLGSVVGATNHDGSKDRTQVGRTLRRLNQRVSLKSHEKNRSKGFALVTMLATEFVSSPSFREQAVWNYKRVHDNNVLKGIADILFKSIPVLAIPLEL